MITPLQKDDALLADIRSARADRDTPHLWWLGQSGFLVQWQDRHLLIDPYLSESLTKKYAGTDKPHVRMTELVIDPSRLDFIDVVTSSHNHTDHLDGETLIPLLQSNPDVNLVVPEANRAFAADRIGVDRSRLIGLDQGQQETVAGFTIHAVAAAHEEVELDDRGRCKYLGYVFQTPGFTIYHSGDTLLYDGMEEQLRAFSIDVALLPINGRAPERRVAGNLNAGQAVGLARAVGVGTVIPCHYDMFEFNTADPRTLAEAAEANGQAYKIMQCGERWDLPVSPAGGDGA